MRRFFLGVLLLLAAALPFIFQGYWLYVAIVGLYYAVLASSWAMLAGQVGIISFAHAAFAAVGAYTSAMLVIYLNFPIPLAMVAGSGAAAVFGLAIGALTLKMRGPYLALTTLAFSEIFRIFLTAEYELTRGSYGLKVPLMLDGNKTWCYYIGLLLLVATVTTLSLVLRSKLGLFLLAMREDEDGAATRGVNTVYYRLCAFVITSACAGLAGGFYAHVIGLVSPRISTISEMGLILAMSVFGGLESLMGSALGALALQSLTEYLRAFEEWRLAIFGGLVLLILKFTPQGLLPRLSELLDTCRQRKSNMLKDEHR
ncbi:branched-chain amino acid ABC transporter permease [Desulfoferrobacter suflitae]|uniref:branched-chain amino acid ABC transporter permease n=1 Tax=Desulfoferrobacter suflitae TaxID=2865782 RepID=UPI002164DD55|nr:branched-chain amino acid ABC transporter permease [Desulfoferrobacter suflitae]MCK8602516.1 branched-chain amino acid ABC transporter permease [Desulfoferrobacter suflitae]